jgi:hypothetical protein
VVLIPSLNIKGQESYWQSRLAIQISASNA